MNKLIASLFFLLALIACGDAVGNNNEGGTDTPDTSDVSKQNLLRAIALTDNAINNYFTGDGMAMARYYNPYTGTRSDEKGSIWMYTSSIEAVNAILHALEARKENGDSELYDLNFDRYKLLLSNLHENAAYYKGTFRLTSYTQTKQWSVYGVNRGGSKGGASVDGVNNVYDDQQWFVRELIEAYRVTDESSYLGEAEYLTSYVLDGWDCVPDANGEEYGGITWGPGYVTKHSCSNGPMVSPLVWLSELYKDKDDQIVYRYIDSDYSRKTMSMKKTDYYLKFAKAVYNWQKNHLLRSDGVYDDFMGGCDPNCDVVYETINGVTYRKHTNLKDRVEPPYSYNSGTMLSGAADLYIATGDSTYLKDIENLTRASFSYFATKNANVTGYYTYDVTGFNDWFNNVLMRGYIDAYPVFKYTSTCIKTFQQNLDYGYDHFLYNGFLPTNLLVGWSLTKSNNNVEAMFTFSFAAEYASLARYEIEK
ncbi:MAG: glycoside hydrolase family 76 protein [Paludibacter sp.]|nr:glycoside hydrolase family 76 protein [Paludibacter sp.]